MEDKTRRGRAHLAPPHGNHGDVGHDFDYDYHLAPPMVIMVIMIIMLMMTITEKTMINISDNICPINSFITIQEGLLN